MPQANAMSVAATLATMRAWCSCRCCCCWCMMLPTGGSLEGDDHVDHLEEEKARRKRNVKEMKN